MKLLEVSNVFPQPVPTGPNTHQLLQSSWSVKFVLVVMHRLCSFSYMALQKKQYRSSTNRSRGGGLTKMVRSATPKDYGKQVRSFHGPNANEVQEKLAAQIKRVKTYG
jgi:hypothetical protein